MTTRTTRWSCLPWTCPRCGAVTQKEVPGDLDPAGVDRAVEPDLVELVPSPDAVPPAGAVPDAAAARTVIVTVPQVPAVPRAKRLKAVPGPAARPEHGHPAHPGGGYHDARHQRADPGPSERCGVHPARRGGHLRRASVDYAAIAAGITV